MSDKRHYAILFPYLEAATTLVPRLALVFLPGLAPPLFRRGGGVGGGRGRGAGAGKRAAEPRRRQETTSKWMTLQ